MGHSTPPLPPDLEKMLGQIEKVSRRNAHTMHPNVWQASIAISAKRMADRLDQICEILEKSGDAMRGIERSLGHRR